MGRKSKGNVMEMVVIGITILGMSVVVMAYLECSGLIMKKLEISQLSRQYILKMETEGYLTEENRQALIQELQKVGLQEIDLSGTTLQPVSYGDTILLNIRGTIRARTVGEGEDIWNVGFSAEKTPVEEKLMSTAKN